MRTLRNKLTYANVISTLCLFLVLGGGAAVAAGQLPKNSVGTKQLKNDAVTGKKIKKSEHRSDKLTPARDHGLEGDERRKGAGPAGATGATGRRAELRPGRYAGTVAYAESRRRTRLRRASPRLHRCRRRARYRRSTA